MSDGRYETWHAIHDDCPPYGCGKCVVIDVEWTDEEWRDIQMYAKMAGEDVDVFIHRSIVMGMNHENSRN